MLIIDADAHVAIPEEMFAEGLPAGLQERRPKLVPVDGHYFWVVEGRLVPKPAGRGPGTPRGFMSWMEDPSAQKPDASRAATLNDAPKDHCMDNVHGRLEDMDKEGIQIQVLYPDLIMVDPGIEDSELACAMARSYNDYIAAKCTAQNDRLKRIAVVALQDPNEAAREMNRCVTQLGCIGVVIPALVGERLLNHRDFEPFFEEANRLSTAVGLHAVTGVYSMPWENLFTSNFGTHLVAMPVAYMVAMSSLFDGQMMERYPNIRFAFLESGCGWAPYWVKRIDEHIESRYKGSGIPASRYVREGRLFFGCEPGEYHIPHVIEELGDDCLLYSSDYPHGDSKWPDTIHLMNEVKGLSQESKAKILGANSMSFYSLGIKG